MTAQRSEFPATAISLAEDRSPDCGREVTTTLICDNPLLRSGIQHVLSGTPFTLVEDSPAIDPKLVSGKAQGPVLVILAVGQPSNRTPEIVRQAKERYPAARLVLLADHVDLSLVTQGREAGVDGFCLSGSSRY